MRPILIACLLAATFTVAPKPAAAFNFAVDCKNTTLTTGFMEGLRRQSGVLGLLLNYKKRNTDAYQLISAGNGAMMQVWSGLMCAATGGNSAAVGLRNRWSGAIGTTTDGFTIGRAYRFYMKRVKYAAPDNTHLLSDGERALITETLATMAQFGPQYAQAQALLTQKLGL
jgi:hypothetical protein